MENQKVRATIFLLLWLAACTLPVDMVKATPVRDITNLTSISFWERTGGTSPVEFEFGINDTELTTRLSDPLGSSNNDIFGAPTEYYDVYYSNADGGFNLDGEYLSISGVFLFASPAGGGLNLAEIGLNFSSDPIEFGNYVASFVALGDNAIPADVTRAIDGDLQTHTTMGNTIGESERLRVTLGFLSSSGPPPDPIPEPSTILLLGTGLIGVAGLARRRKS